eukprot:348204-Rhodomonas_salina.4
MITAKHHDHRMAATSIGGQAPFETPQAASRLQALVECMLQLSLVQPQIMMLCDGWPHHCTRQCLLRPHWSRSRFKGPLTFTFPKSCQWNTPAACQVTGQ